MSAIGAFLGGLFGLAGTQIQNNSNYDIARMNLDYQRERNAIEDERYENETAYNRAFAEDERDYQRKFAEDERAYNRALQQEIFNREDTALERQASSLSQMGINPLSQQMNGLGAGQALTPSIAPSGVSEPSFSSRGGQALHNDMRYENLLNGISPIMSMMDTINGLKTGEYQRDLLRSQRDRQDLENQEKIMDNLIKANQYGISFDSDGNISIKPFNHLKQDFEDVEYKDKSASADRNQRENVFQNEYSTHDNSSKEELILTALENQLENNNPLGRAVDPILKTYNAFKNPLGTGLLTLIGLGATKIKKYAESKKNDDKKPFWKNWFQTPSEMEENYRR